MQDQTFEEWLREVDRLFRSYAGISIQDMASYLFTEDYSQGLTPRESLKRAIESWSEEDSTFAQFSETVLRRLEIPENEESDQGIEIQIPSLEYTDPILDVASDMEGRYIIQKYTEETINPLMILTMVRGQLRTMGEQIAEGEIQDIIGNPELMGEYLENLRETFEHFDRVLLRVEETIRE